MYIYKYILKNLDSLLTLSLLTESEVSLGLIAHLITYVWWLGVRWTYHCESICTMCFSQCWSLKYRCRTSQFARCFLPAHVRIWNDLPDTVFNIGTLDGFKGAVKRWLLHWVVFSLIFCGVLRCQFSVLIIIIIADTYCFTIGPAPPTCTVCTSVWSRHYWSSPAYLYCVYFGVVSTLLVQPRSQLNRKVRTVKIMLLNFVFRLHWLLIFVIKWILLKSI